MMELRFTAKFKKDYKRIKRQGKDISKLEVLARESRARGDARPLAERDVPRAPGVPYRAGLAAHLPYRRGRTRSRRHAHGEP